MLLFCYSGEPGSIQIKWFLCKCTKGELDSDSRIGPVLVSFYLDLRLLENNSSELPGELYASRHITYVYTLIRLVHAVRGIVALHRVTDTNMCFPSITRRGFSGRLCSEARERNERKWQVFRVQQRVPVNRGRRPVSRRSPFEHGDNLLLQSS